MDRQDAIDPSERSMLLNLFTEIAILEHLVRERFNPKNGNLTPQQFGIINYLVRQRKSSEKLRTLAWCFQIEDAEAIAAAESLAALRYVEIDWFEGERCVFITAAGQARHAKFLDDVGPDVMEIVADIDPEHLRITTDTLMELRRTIDNLPDR
jgi:DNA-binding MarR family transcriptional regulator